MHISLRQRCGFSDYWIFCNTRLSIHGVDDLQHFFFECKNYKAIQHDLINWVQSLLSLVDYDKRPILSTSLLLAPFCYEQISNRVSNEILDCTFEYIRKSNEVCRSQHIMYFKLHHSITSVSISGSLTEAVIVGLR